MRGRWWWGRKARAGTVRGEGNGRARAWGVFAKVGRVHGRGGAESGACAPVSLARRGCLVCASAVVRYGSGPVGEDDDRCDRPAGSPLYGHTRRTQPTHSPVAPAEGEMGLGWVRPLLHAAVRTPPLHSPHRRGHCQEAAGGVGPPPRHPTRGAARGWAAACAAGARAGRHPQPPTPPQRAVPSEERSRTSWLPTALNPPPPLTPTPDAATRAPLTRRPRRRPRAAAESAGWWWWWWRWCVPRVPPTPSPPPPPPPPGGWRSGHRRGPLPSPHRHWHRGKGAAAGMAVTWAATGGVAPRSSPTPASPRLAYPPPHPPRPPGPGTAGSSSPAPSPSSPSRMAWWLNPQLWLIPPPPPALAAGSSCPPP